MKQLIDGPAITRRRNGFIINSTFLTFYQDERAITLSLFKTHSQFAIYLPAASTPLYLKDKHNAFMKTRVTLNTR